MLADPAILQLAQHLHDHRLARRESPRLSEAHPGLDVETGYRVMRAGVALRTAAGERVVGYKMGLTSKAKREQMNLPSPCYGTLTDRMAVPDGGTFEVAGGIHPKIEPEVAFRTARELKGRVSREEALAACDGVAAAMEIIDSRYAGFKYFSLPDVVADNSSSSHFVVSADWRAPAQAPDLLQARITLSVDGQVKQSAPGSAISGDPVLSLVQLVEMLDAHGLALPAGSVVLAGAATVAEVLAPGQRVEAEVEGLGRVSVLAR
jgi:2-oxo-3-hexenedioate decarboxylase